MSEKREVKQAARWIIFNMGSGMEFAECSRCGGEFDKDRFEYDEYDMPRRCGKCGAIMTDIEFAD